MKHLPATPLLGEEHGMRSSIRFLALTGLFLTAGCMTTGASSQASGAAPGHNGQVSTGEQRLMSGLVGCPPHELDILADTAVWWPAWTVQCRGKTFYCSRDTQNTYCTEAQPKPAAVAPEAASEPQTMPPEVAPEPATTPPGPASESMPPAPGESPHE
jgi:hypothetical protein